MDILFRFIKTKNIIIKLQQAILSIGNSEEGKYEMKNLLFIYSGNRKVQNNKLVLRKSCKTSFL